MKTSNILLAGLAAVAFITPASAANLVIRVTGSSAFRGLVDTKLTAASPTGLGYTRQAGASSSSFQVYTLVTNTPNSGDKTIIKTSWSGSVAGIKTVTSSDTTVKFLPDDSVIAAPASDGSDSTDTGTAPDMAFSDVFQESTLYRTPTLTKTKVGVVQFRAITNYGSPITKVNYQQLRVLFTTATGMPLSSFVAGDTSGSKVYGIGRDPDSGTRITLLAESGIGANSTVVHWQPHVSALAPTTIDTLIPWPVSSAFGVTFSEGNGGYPSGGDLAKIMRYDTSSVSVSGGTAAPCYFISFASIGDAGTAIAAHNPPTTVGAGPGHILTIENNDSDVPSTAQLSLDIANGLNTMWSYEWSYHNGLSGDKLAFYTAISNLMAGSANGGISLANMKVHRLADGGPILPGAN